jgi:hypothetical protein
MNALNNLLLFLLKFMECLNEKKKIKYNSLCVCAACHAVICPGYASALRFRAKNLIFRWQSSRTSALDASLARLFRCIHGFW